MLWHTTFSRGGTAGAGGYVERLAEAGRGKNVKDCQKRPSLCTLMVLWGTSCNTPQYTTLLIGIKRNAETGPLFGTNIQLTLKLLNQSTYQRGTQRGGMIDFKVRWEAFPIILDGQ